MVHRKSISSFILFIIILLLWQCKGKEEEDFRVITVKGSNVGRLLDYNIGFSALDSLGYVSLLTRNGDWLSTDSFFFSVRRNLPDTIQIHQLDSLMYINGELTGIFISKDSPPLSFFKQLSNEDISHLQTIQFENPIWDSMRPYLKKIALVNPAVDIVFSEMDSIALLNQDLLWLSHYFQPKALFLMNETDSISFSSLAKFPSLETLLITYPKKGDDYLPYLPNLKEIMLFNDEDSTYVGSDFFKENPDLESLKIIDYEVGHMDWTSLDILNNLRNLYIETDSISLNAIYEHHPHLEYLHLGSNKEGVFNSGIFKKNNLKWLSLYPADDPFMGLNPKTLQDSFPELESLEFENNDSLLDYRNFKTFKNLKYLTVVGEVGLDSTLHNLDHLRYLSLSDDFLKDSVNVVKVKRAMPNTIIAPNSGACLGSGWLLLIIPLAGLWFYFLKSKTFSGQ
jgi:hypothetical protein